jgi:hypothetical protein
MHNLILLKTNRPGEKVSEDKDGWLKWSISNPMHEPPKYGNGIGGGKGWEILGAFFYIYLFYVYVYDLP